MISKPLIQLSRTTLALLLACSAGAVMAETAQPATGTKSGNIVVNGKTIAALRADMMVREQVSQGAPDSDQLRGLVREQIIRMETISQAARSAGTDKRPEVQQAMDMARDTVLARAYLQDFMGKLKINDADLRRDYEATKAAVGDKEYKVRHILLKTEDAAKDVIARMGKGEKFEKLAELSEDPGSKARGGDLGWAVPATFVKPFADAMTHLEKGKYTSTPVKSDFGWHVIWMEDIRTLKTPSFEEAKPQLIQRAQQVAVERHILELRQKAKVQ